MYCLQHSAIQSKFMLAATQMTFWDMSACHILSSLQKGSCLVQLDRSVCLEMSKQQSWVSPFAKHVMCTSQIYMIMPCNVHKSDSLTQAVSQLCCLCLWATVDLQWCCAAWHGSSAGLACLRQLRSHAVRQETAFQVASTSCSP